MEVGRATISSYVVLLFLIASLIGGCAVSVRPQPTASSPPAINASADAPAVPVSTQMLKVVPELKTVRFQNLLNFETNSDKVFIAPSNLRIQTDNALNHTGRSSLRISGRGGKLTIKLASLLGSARKFPGDWTLAGGYFYSETSAQVLVSYEVSGTAIAKSATTLSPGTWTAVMLDLANMADTAPIPAGPATLTFTIDNTADGNIWCDDVVLIDNTQWYVGRLETAQAGNWSVVRRGLNYICGNSDRYVIRLAPADVTKDGWKLEEANGFRARFSSTGKNKFLTIFPDGRTYWDGLYRPLAAELRSEPRWAEQQSSPAIVEVAETTGRLERRSPGDENNDGYNEARAAYMILAAGPRLEATITPQSTPILRPQLEISGMPAGDALVTVEGRLVERMLRLEDGTLLVEIPGLIERAIKVNVRIQ